jgi:hypothetical protein
MRRFVRGTNCFGLNNYTQLPLAFAFLAALAGETDLAKQELEDHLRGDWIKDAIAMKLRRILSQCT